MGTSYTVYLGPYIEAPNPLKASKREFHGCPKHMTPSSAKFCTECGTAIKLLSVPSTSRADFNTYKEFNDSLWELGDDDRPSEKADSAIFAPNKGKFGFRFRAYDAEIVPLNETIIVGDVSRFTTVFAKEIARIKEVFGSAEVKWGAIAYAS
jgi:hypothetical protein